MFSCWAMKCCSRPSSRQASRRTESSSRPLDGPAHERRIQGRSTHRSGSAYGQRADVRPHASALFPLAAKHAMELHYFPSLGGEFFLWETDKRGNSQFHAAPAGDFTRVEIESQVTRTMNGYSSRRPSERGAEECGHVSARSSAIRVEAGNLVVRRRPQRSSPDGARGSGADRIVNISFYWLCRTLQLAASASADVGRRLKVTPQAEARATHTYVRRDEIRHPKNP